MRRAELARAIPSAGIVIKKTIMDNIKELEEIRQQLSELKQRLDRESVLNEQLLHDSLKMKIRSVHNIVGQMIVISILGI